MYETHQDYYIIREHNALDIVFPIITIFGNINEQSASNIKHTEMFSNNHRLIDRTIAIRFTCAIPMTLNTLNRNSSETHNYLPAQRVNTPLRSPTKLLIPREKPYFPSPRAATQKSSFLVKSCKKGRVSFVQNDFSSRARVRPRNEPLASRSQRSGKNRRTGRVDTEGRETLARKRRTSV